MMIWQSIRHARRWAGGAMSFSLLCGPSAQAHTIQEMFTLPANLRPMPPTEVNIQTGGSIPFSREILRYGLTLDMPLFLKSLYDLRQKASLLAEKTSLAHTLELSSRKAAVVASAS